MAELTYMKAGDYLIPNLALDSEESMEELPLGRYGRLRAKHLQERHNGTYTSLLLTERLEPHLREIDRQAQEQMDRMVESLMKQNSVDEAMKARNQMGWIQAVNSFKAQAEEIILAEIVYK